MSYKILTYNKRFPLESGLSLPQLEITYHTYGTLNADKSNVIWVAHALTANSDVFEWWPGLFGENDLFNPQDYFIVCCKICMIQTLSQLKSRVKQLEVENTELELQTEQLAKEIKKLAGKSAEHFPA